MHEPPDVPQPPDPDQTPATRADLRSLRRWLVVAGIWAVAASAIGLIALLNQNDNSNENAQADQITRLQRELKDLSGRVDTLDEQVSAAARSDDLANLEKRVSRVEDDVKTASDDAEKASTKASDLDSRVSDLESQSSTGTGATTPGNGNANGQGNGNSP